MRLGRWHTGQGFTNDFPQLRQNLAPGWAGALQDGQEVTTPLGNWMFGGGVAGITGAGPTAVLGALIMFAPQCWQKKDCNLTCLPQDGHNRM
jgi:hypothetical protein